MAFPLRRDPTPTQRGDDGRFLSFIERTLQRIDVWSRDVDSSRIGAYGQMSLESPPDPFPDLGVAWQDIDAYDASLDVGGGIIMDTATGRFTVIEPAVYSLAFFAALNHNSVAGASRNLAIRLFDVTAGAQISTPAVFGTGRDQVITNMSINALFPVLTLNAGSVYVIQISSPSDVYSACQFLGCNLMLARVGEFPS